jgi:uncharacterized protein (TIGR03067 family)
VISDFALLRVRAMKALLACALGLLLITSALGGDGKKDLDKLQGKWLTDLDGKKVEMAFAKDKFTITFSDGNKEVIFKVVCKIGPSNKPKHIDLTIEEGIKFVGDTALGIYELDGDTLKWHANQPGKVERPSEFPAVQGEVAGGLYLVLKRSK